MRALIAPIKATLIRLIVMIISISLICGPTPWMIEWRGQLYFPKFGQSIPSESSTLSGQASLIHSRQNSINNQKYLGKHWPMLIPYSEHQVDLDYPFLSPPSWNHWLGTDSIGRDILAMILLGLQQLAALTLMFSIACFFIGTTLGTISGYYGGKVDRWLQSFFIVWKNLPLIYIIIIVRTFIELNEILVLGIMVCFGWGKFYQMSRYQAIRLKRLPTMLSLKAVGLSERKLIFKHYLPLCAWLNQSYFPWHFTHGLNALITSDLIGSISLSSQTLGPVIYLSKNKPEAYWVYGGLAFLLTLMFTLLFSHNRSANVYEKTKDPYAFSSMSSR